MTTKKVPKTESKQVDTETTSQEKGSVTFIKPWDKYSRDDTAGFNAKKCAELINMKVAVEGTELPKQED